MKKELTKLRREKKDEEETQSEEERPVQRRTEVDDGDKVPVKLSTKPKKLGKVKSKQNKTK